MDHLSVAERGALMSKIKGKNTKPEMIIRRLIWGQGFRYRLHGKNLPGSPDLVFASKKKVIFVHGCFWHGHKCRKGKLPKTRTEFWQQKIERNSKRDLATSRKLRAMGWRSLTIWECEVKKDKILSKILKFLAS